MLNLLKRLPLPRLVIKRVPSSNIVDVYIATDKKPGDLVNISGVYMRVVTVHRYGKATLKRLPWYGNALLKLTTWVRSELRRYERSLVSLIEGVERDRTR